MWSLFHTLPLVAAMLSHPIPVAGSGPKELSPKPLHTLNGHNHTITCVDFSPDSKWLGSSCLGNLAIVWDAGTGKESFRREHEDQVYAIRFHPKDGTVFTGCFDGRVRAWEIGKPGNKKPKAVFREPFGDRGIGGLAINPAGNRMLAVVSSYNGALLWDLKTGNSKLLPADAEPLNDVAFAPSGEQAAVAHTSKTANIWDLSKEKVTGTITSDSLILRICYGSGGKLIATGEHSKVVRIWDATTLKEIGATAGHRDTIEGIQFTPDGKYLLSCCGAEEGNGEVRVWDVAAKKDVAWFAPHKKGCMAMAISPDGKRLATAGFDGEIRIWDLAAILADGKK